MFSGIIEAVSIVKAIHYFGDCLILTILSPAFFHDLKLGDSISVNGACLTIIELKENSFSVEVVPETQRKTNLSLLKVNSLINLERALSVSSRLHGHYVQAHIDFMGELIDIETDGERALIVKISIPKQFTKHIVSKGFIAIDGMSITIIEATESWFTATFIPYTQERTIIRDYQIGDKVNIEVDILSKYVEKILTEKAA